MAKPPHVDLEIWRSLYDAALTYAQQRPWDILSDQDLFALRSPRSDETLYACTIGQEKISYGLLVFRGEEGYASYRWIAESGTKPDVDGYIAKQNQITLEFVQKKELDKFDRKVISGGDRLIVPLLFLVADQASGFILDSNVSQEFGEPHKVMADGLLNAMEKNQMRPSSILVKKGTLAAALAPLARALGIPISEAKRLPMIDTARQAMKKHFVG